MGGDRSGRGFGISWMGEDGCCERQLWPRNCFVYVFQLHFFNILKVFGWVLGAPGLRLGSDWAPWLHIDVLGGHFWCFKARLWVSLGAL
jgi:hypothetical protein